MEKGSGLTSLAEELSKFGKKTKSTTNLEKRVARLEKQVKELLNHK